MFAFYRYRQNNSGGYFIGAEVVFIRAESPEQANEIAEQNDIYFDGVRSGRDCGCCGCRWSEAWETDAYSPEEIGAEIVRYGRDNVRIIV